MPRRAPGACRRRTTPARRDRRLPADRDRDHGPARPGGGRHPRRTQAAPPVGTARSTTGGGLDPPSAARRGPQLRAHLPSARRPCVRSRRGRRRRAEHRRETRAGEAGGHAMTTSPMPAQVTVLRDELHAEVSDRLAAAVRHGEVDDRTAFVEDLVTDVVREYTVSALRRGQQAVPDEVREQLRRSLMDAFTGLGDLQPLIDDPDIENIDVNGAENVFITYAGGKRVRVGPVASSDEELADTLRKVAASLGVQERRFDPGLPRLNLRLPGGARLFAVMSVTERVCVSIRRHRFMQLTLAELARLGTMTPAMAQLFEAMVAARLNIVVSGGMDTGKTTMVRALCSAIRSHERIITVEDPYELSLDTDPAHPDVVPMQPATATSRAPAASTWSSWSAGRPG
ncbi:hypothetical protein DVH21_28665 [Micromonospora aurantiaca]|uniref:Bacterial type II secretion system protein E domain-containing protein n=2 Tax=Micromonospora aurantiaca (nom. illeg.) TaxID=47850 RepID=A0A6N3K5Y9_9ACTN|nr:hypothetical protein DVH21_28665 [Micromonospora aurantiaca]